VRVCVCACVRACACMRACVRVCAVLTGSDMVGQDEPIGMSPRHPRHSSPPALPHATAHAGLPRVPSSACARRRPRRAEVRRTHPSPVGTKATHTRKGHSLDAVNDLVNQVHSVDLCGKAGGEAQHRREGGKRTPCRRTAVQRTARKSAHTARAQPTRTGEDAQLDDAVKELAARAQLLDHVDRVVILVHLPARRVRRGQVGGQHRSAGAYGRMGALGALGGRRRRCAAALGPQLHGATSRRLTQRGCLMRCMTAISFWIDSRSKRGWLLKMLLTATGWSGRSVW